MVGRITPPKDVHVLIPGPCEYIMSHDKGQLRWLNLLTWRQGDPSNYLDGLNVNTKGEKVGESESEMK